MNSPTKITEMTWLPVDAAIAGRRSKRAFLPHTVPLHMVRAILDLARQAPSGSNIQPWKVRVLAGEAKEELSAAVHKRLEGEVGETADADWSYYPLEWREPYLSRRRKSGWGLYNLVGIGKGDIEANKRFRRKNFDFFDAPVGMIFTLDRDVQIGSWLDLGIFLGHVAIAARGLGLDTCPQQSWSNVQSTVHQHLRLPENEVVICGMALGYADPDAPQNTLQTERLGVDEIATFEGF